MFKSKLFILWLFLLRLLEPYHCCCYCLSVSQSQKSWMAFLVLWWITAALLGYFFKAILFRQMFIGNFDVLSTRHHSVNWFVYWLVSAQFIHHRTNAQAKWAGLLEGHWQKWAAGHVVLWAALGRAQIRQNFCKQLLRSICCCYQAWDLCHDFFFFFS